MLLIIWLDITAGYSRTMCSWCFRQLLLVANCVQITRCNRLAVMLQNSKLQGGSGGVRLLMYCTIYACGMVWQ